MPGLENVEDCFDAFGESDDDDDGEEDESTLDSSTKTVEKDGKHYSRKTLMTIATQLSSYITQVFVKQNLQIRLCQRKVLMILASLEKMENELYQGIASSLKLREIQVQHVVCCREMKTKRYDADAVLCCLNDTLDDSSIQYLHDVVQNCLCPGGTLIVSKQALRKLDEDTIRQLHSTESETSIIIPQTAISLETIQLVAKKKKSVRAHSTTCPWLPSSHDLVQEEEYLHQATISLSVHEIVQSRLSEQSIQNAVHAMRQYGYCILPHLLNPMECQEWGEAVLESVHQASVILKERDGVDIYHPHNNNSNNNIMSTSEPQSYRELSMRDDLRLDIRQGPTITKLRQKKGDNMHGDQSIVLTASENDYCNGIFLRGHPSLLDIVRRTMNPKDDTLLYRGNIGRWNFGGRGSDGSFQDLRVSPVGGIVTLPGAADQAWHADTPHLFENIADLPAHYINLFAPCTPFDEQVGGTALVHGSHNLAFTARYCAADGNSLHSTNHSQLYPFLVRPCLTLGDILLFDCRIVHFGMANLSKNNVERCICYTNTWQNWFYDAKNWEEHRRIFLKDNEEDTHEEKNILSQSKQ